MRITTENGTILSLEDIQAAIMRLTDQEELQLFGRPMPALTDPKHPLHIADNFPGKELYEEWAKSRFEELKATTESDAAYVNSWTVMGYDVVVFKDDKGYGALRVPHAQWKMTSLVKTAILRYGSVTAKAECKALARLASHVSESQFDNYILSGTFVETSERSGVKYWFRKSAPTLAFRFEDGKDGKCLAALCLHPMGYYADTSAGCMTPTDEVIAHLLLMRGDEHYFWRKANQHRTWDPRSGI